MKTPPNCIHINFNLFKVDYRCLSKIILFCLLSTLVIGYGQAQWSADPEVNTVVNNDPGAQSRHLAVTDGKDGAITAWIEAYEENGVEYEYDVAIQHIERYGYITWDSGGYRGGISSHFKLANSS